jgi:L-threonylcarbamoyladenylate synthase
VSAEPRTPTVAVDGRDDAERFDAAVEQAVATLDAGGTVVVPTDTVYGVAARIDRLGALEQLFDLKRRERANPLAVLVADRSQALDLGDLSTLDAPIVEAISMLMDRSWPGALTVVVPRSDAARAADLGGDAATIGVRCPSSPVVRAIAARTGPLATTSANRSGAPTPSTAAAAAQGLAGSVDLVIDAGPCTERPSTVVDATRVPFRILRAGPVEVADLGLPSGFVAPNPGDGHA